MSQKSSVPQVGSFVSQALKRDTPKTSTHPVTLTPRARIQLEQRIVLR